MVSVWSKLNVQEIRANSFTDSFDQKSPKTQNNAKIEKYRNRKHKYFWIWSSAPVQNRRFHPFR